MITEPVRISSHLNKKTEGKQGDLQMDVRILKLIDGAKEAEGLTVIIDVFRAFTLEAYMFAAGAEYIYPVGALEEAFELKKNRPDWILCGERGGAKIEGCDYGNSPAQIAGAALNGKTIIHSTSAGTQGIVNASGADEIITASLANADAVVSYILAKKPEKVSIVAMGKSGTKATQEDDLCAEYIKCRLEGGIMDVQKKADELRFNGGEHFFDLSNQSVFPMQDFYLSTKCNIFPFVICVGKDEEGKYRNHAVSV